MKECHRRAGSPDRAEGWGSPATGIRRECVSWCQQEVGVVSLRARAVSLFLGGSGCGGSPQVGGDAAACRAGTPSHPHTLHRRSGTARAGRSRSLWGGVATHLATFGRAMTVLWGNSCSGSGGGAGGGVTTRCLDTKYEDRVIIIVHETKCDTIQTGSKVTLPARHTPP